MRRVNKFGIRRGLGATHGFTLVEVMTVLVVISLISIFALPKMQKWRARMRLKGAADTLVSDLQKAKMYAIKHNTNVTFTFAAAATCPGGSYIFKDTSGNEVASQVMNDSTDKDSKTTNVCLKTSTYAAAAPFDGFTSRGLPINPTARTVTISATDLSDTGDPTYTITQSIAGGISLAKDALP